MIGDGELERVVRPAVEVKRSVRRLGEVEDFASSRAQNPPSAPAAPPATVAQVVQAHGQPRLRWTS